MAKANTPILTEVTIQSSDGWTDLASASTIFDGKLEAYNGAFSIRHNGGTAVLMASGESYDFLGIELADIEVSTASGSDVTFRVIGNTTTHK